jgi:8-oxo-dGTP diphosphatase
MDLPHRIAAGAIVFREQRVLLVRYLADDNTTYLVGPGGGLEQTENIIQAIQREVWEETHIRVQPKSVVLIEDIVFPQFKMCKIWMISDYIAGTIEPTDASQKEGIISAGWFEREELQNEVVFPPELMKTDWERLMSGTLEISIPDSRDASVVSTS